MSLFGQLDYMLLSDIVFAGDYPGYKPDVIEAPHGDGRLDVQKRYAHVATKYTHPDDGSQGLLDACLMQAHRLALKVAKAINVPDAFMPRLDFGALRVLYYPPGAGSHEHTDFDLFAITLYRDQPDRFVADTICSDPFVREQRTHLGELAEEIGLGAATRHSVLPSDTEQRSIVYFAIPDWNAALSGGRTVRTWLEERIARSRVNAGGLETGAATGEADLLAGQPGGERPTDREDECRACTVGTRGDDRTPATDHRTPARPRERRGRDGGILELIRSRKSIGKCESGVERGLLA